MKLSVIVPVRNGGGDLHRCLEALAGSTRPPDELIVVDDGSTDDSARTAQGFGAQVLQTAKGPVGPAAARNCGAVSAHGEVLVFIDADVAVHADTLARIESYLSRQPEVAALFGSYDDAPPKPGLISRYKNLQHHFTHQNGRREANTFWAGCGAVRRSVFAAIGGFDARYARPSIEDIELGVRLRRAGHRVWLCPDVQVAHLKRWTLISWLRADIRDRAIPWTRLILSGARLPADLGLDIKSQISAVVAWVLIFSLLAALAQPWWLAGAVAAAGLLVGLNAGLYRLFMRRAGARFALGAILLHLLFYMYSSFIFGNLFIWHGLHRAYDAVTAAFKPEALVKEAKHDGS
jgi:glycosyltransferase involved in cell wall biosynthesis